MWRLFDFRFTRHPPLMLSLPLAGAIYLDFFSHHDGADLRHVLFAGTLRLFGRTVVSNNIWHVHRSVPLLVSFGLVALFIPLAKTIGTGTRVWLYPNQKPAGRRSRRPSSALSSCR